MPSNRNDKGSTAAVMSTGAYVVASLIMCIPVIGLIIYIYWAFGGCKNLNRRNFARAALILFAVGVVITLISWLFVSKLIGLLGGGGLQGLLGMLKQAGLF